MDNYKETDEKNNMEDLTQEPAGDAQPFSRPPKNRASQEGDEMTGGRAATGDQPSADEPADKEADNPPEPVDVQQMSGDQAAGLEETQGAGAQETLTKEPGTETEPQVSQQEDEMLFNRRKIKNLEDENKRLSNELEALRERTLRLSAEYENYRKRTLKEKEEIKSSCTAKLLKEILPVMDNLERALVTETDDLPGLKEGVQITLDLFIQSLKKIGVELIATDQPFDPHLHEAVMHEQDPSKGEKEIVEVFLKGYKIGDKVIRHTVVKVVN